MVDGATVGEIIGSPDRAMGAKAVFGPISSHVLCFGARGERHETRYFSVPAGAARRAIEAPWVFAIGGGSNVRDGLEGCVLNIVRVSCVYGETSAFVNDDEASRLAQWPVAIALHDVWELTGHPHLVRDLGLPDRRLLAGSQDGIVRPEEHFGSFWEAVRGHRVTLKTLPWNRDFHDNGKPRLVSQLLPKLAAGSEEGKAVWKLQVSLERDPSHAREAKRLNMARHGIYTCEACLFPNNDAAMFDAHHPNPLCAGVRTTRPEHLIVLCPTCHRRAHRKERLTPYSLEELIDWNRCGRP